MGETSDRVRPRWRWWLVTAGVVSVVLVVAGAMFLRAANYFVRQTYGHGPSQPLRHLYDSAVVYYQQPRTDPDGRPLAPRFPDTVGPTPPTPACAGGKPFEREVGPADFDAPTWRALNFMPYSPSRYQFEFISSGTGPDAVFTARAIGDLDCDGVLATFERVGTIAKDGTVNGGVGLKQVNEDE